MAVEDYLPIGMEDDMWPRDQEPFTIDYHEIVNSTELAICVTIEDNIFADRYWLPISQIALDEDAKEITMPEWLALEKGFI